MTYVPPAVVRFAKATQEPQVKLLEIWQEAEDEIEDVEDKFIRYARTVIRFMEKLKEKNIKVKDNAARITPTSELEQT